jgi:hypothetical protein
MWIVALCAVRLAAAPPTAALTGRISDARAEPVADAFVSVVSDDTGLRRSTRSGPDGDFGIGGLSAGSYKVTVRKPGFQTVTRLHVPLGEGARAAVDFTLTIGSIKQTITVESTVILTNTDDGSVGTPVSRRLIEPLPLNGRGLVSVAELAPGVVATPAASGEAGQFTANGQRANTNYFTVDGISANSGVAGGGLPAQFSGGTLPGMTAFGSLHALAAAESVEEVRVQTSTFAPEYGRLPGAQVMLTTRSGTDELHGTAAFSLRNEKLNANSWVANRDALGRAQHRLAQGEASAGGSAGRSRWFAAFEDFDLTQPLQFRIAVPSIAARAAAGQAERALLNAFPLPNIGVEQGLIGEYAGTQSRNASFASASFRFDRPLTPTHNFFARVHYAPSESEFGTLQTYRARFRHGVVTAGLTSTPRATLVNDFRVNRTTDSAEASWESSPIDLSRLLRGQQATWYAVNISGLGGWTSGEGGRNRQSQWSAVDTLAWNRGGHLWRFGMEYQRLLPSRAKPFTSVALEYPSLASAISGISGPPIFQAAERASSLIETVSLFAQDTWRPKPSLTIVYGTRWEVAPPPAYRAASLTQAGPGGNTASSSPAAPGADSVLVPVVPPAVAGGFDPLPSWPTRYLQFAPRFGAAWTHGPFVVRTGWGIFYDLGFSAATDPVNGSVFNRWQNVLAGAGFAGTRTIGFAPDLRLPYSRQWNLSLDWAASASQVLTISAVGSAGRRLLRREGQAGPFSSALEVTNHGSSDYNGLQLQLRRRLARRLQGIVSYSWSHAIDNGSWDSGIYLVEPGRSERASSSFDVRHSFTAAGSYLLPGWLEGWRISTFLRARSAFPIDVLGTANDLGLGFDNSPRPALVPGIPVWLDDSGVPGGRRLNPLAFTMASTAAAALPRNSLRGFGFGQVDVALDRHIPLRDPLTASVRVEVFNLLNHPSFADPVRNFNSPYFGTSTGSLAQMLGRGSPHAGLAPSLQIGGPRTVQLQFRLRF